VRQRPAAQWWLKSNAEVLGLLVQHAVRAVVARESGARVLANIAYGAALTFATLGQLVVKLFLPLAREAERSMGDFNPQTLANTAAPQPMGRSGSNAISSMLAIKSIKIRRMLLSVRKLCLLWDR